MMIHSDCTPKAWQDRRLETLENFYILQNNQIHSDPELFP